MSRLIGGATSYVTPFLNVQEAALRQQGRGPQHDPHEDVPHALEHDAKRPHKTHHEAVGEPDPHHGCDQGDEDDELKEHVVVALGAGVVRGVEAEEEELLP